MAGRSIHAVTMVCVVLLALLGLGGSILTLGDHLMGLNAVLGWMFYVVVAVLVAVGVVVPLVAIAARPVFSLYRLRDADGRAKAVWCRRLVRNLVRNAELAPEERIRVEGFLLEGDAADDLLINFFNESIIPELDRETKRAAKTAFFATAVSQSPLVDGATMLSVSFNLVRTIVARCGFRPTNLALGRIYIRVMASALVASGLEDMDLDALLASVLGGSSGARVSGALLASAGQGFVNAFLVYRIGVMTKRYLVASDGPASMASLRRQSYGEALSLMRSSGFVGEVLQTARVKGGQVAREAARGVKNAAENAGKNACAAVTHAAASAAEKVMQAASFTRKKDGLDVEPPPQDKDEAVWERGMQEIDA